MTSFPEDLSFPLNKQEFLALLASDGGQLETTKAVKL